MNTTSFPKSLSQPALSQPAGVEFDGPPSADSRSDARLVEEVRRGERASFGPLVQRYERRVTKVIGRFVQDADTVDDLTQETFLRVFERLDQFDTSRRFGPWLFSVAVNLTLDHLRKRKRRGWLGFFSEQPGDRDHDPGGSDPRPTLDTCQEVRAVVAMLPEKYRTVLVLRDLENFSTSEIAAITDRKEATIRWRLAEARNRFQDLWSRRQEQGGPTCDDDENTSDRTL